MTFLDKYVLTPKPKNETTREDRIRSQDYEVITHKNFSDGLDDRASIIFYADDLEDISEKLLDVADEIYGPVNVLWFDTREEETKSWVMK